MEAPVVNVGIMTEKAVSFVFHGEYVHTETGKFLTGEQRALFVNGNIVYNGRLFKEIFFEPASPSSSFELKAVTIGRNFHWQRQEDQCFKGAFNLVTGENGIVVINQVDVEEYLTSVISSEMSAQASKELLKAHAVISRSWLLAQIEKNFRLGRKEEKQQNCYRDNEQLIRWYDREDHNIFDVCADDHCQRYQGITRASNPIVQEVIHETRGEILVNGETICDARFSKCCGGVTEQFEHCWEPIPHSYLTALRDSRETTFPDLTQEEEARKWIHSAPNAFCNTADKKILCQVLNNYDQETTDFYRWKVFYKQEELAELIHRKSGIDFGQILDLVPVNRGTSGRIEMLKIVGTHRTFTIGKELEQHYVFAYWNISFAVTVVISIFLVWLYTYRGGIKTIIWTDTLQALCLVAMLIVIIWQVKDKMQLDFAGMVQTLQASQHFRIFEFGDWHSTQHFMKQFFSGIFITIVMTGLDQDMMQKNLSCKSLKDAQKNMYTYGFAFTPVNFLFLSLGVLLLTLASQQQIELPALNDDILPMFCTSGILGHSILIFFTIGIITAAFSSADSALTALTTSFCIDILGVEKEKAQSAKRTRLVVHLMISILFAIIILAFKAINNRSVIDAIYMIASYTYGPLLGLFVFGLFTKKHPRDKFVPYICIVSPLLCFLTDYLVKQHTGYAFGYEMLMLNGAITFGGLWLSSIGNGQLTIRKKSINT